MGANIFIYSMTSLILLYKTFKFLEPQYFLRILLS